MSEKLGRPTSKSESSRPAPTDFEKGADNFTPVVTPEPAPSISAPSLPIDNGPQSQDPGITPQAIHAAANGGPPISRGKLLAHLRNLVQKQPKPPKPVRQTAPVRRPRRPEDTREVALLKETQNLKEYGFTTSIPTSNPLFPGKVLQTQKFEGKYKVIEQIKPKIDQVKRDEENAAQKYYHLKGLEKAKDKSKRPAIGELKRAKLEYDRARSFLVSGLDTEIALQVAEDLKGQNWTDKVTAHYEKLKHAKTGNKLPKNELGSPMTFDEYERSFRLRYTQRYQKMARIYEVGIPHKERELTSRLEALDKRQANIFQKGLGFMHRKNQEMQNGIAKNLVGKQIGFGKKKIKISNNTAMRIGKYGARAVTALTTTAVLGTVSGIVGIGLGTATGTLALGYLGTRLGKTAVRLTAGTAAGIGAGVIFQKYAEKFDAGNLRKKKQKRIASYKDLQHFDKALAIGTKEGIAQRRQVAELLGTSLVSLGFTANSLYQLTEHLTGAHEAAEKLAEIKRLAEQHQSNPDSATVAAPTPETAHTDAPPATTDTQPAPAADTNSAEAPASTNAVTPDTASPADHQVTESAPSSTAGTPEAGAPAAPATPDGSSAAPEVTLTAGQGADHLFVGLNKLVGASSEHSPLTDAILKYPRPHVLAKLLGFPQGNPDGYMQPGDSIKVEDHKLMFHHHGRSFVLMEEVANKKGKITVKFHHHISDAKGKLFPRMEHHAAVAKAPEQVVKAPVPTPEQAQAPTPEHPAETIPAAAADAASTPVPTPTPSSPVDVPAAHEVAPQAPPVQPAAPPSTPPIEDHVQPATPPHETSATPTPQETPPTPQPEAPHEAVSTLPAAPSTPAELIKSSVDWPKFSQAPAQFVFEIPVTDGNEANITFRTEMYDLLRQTGVGPVANEDVATYVARASEVLRQGTQSPVSIVETADHHMIVRGGDMDAQLTLAREFGRIQLDKHIDSHVFVESTAKNNPGWIDISNKPVNSGIAGVNEFAMLKLSDIKLKGATQLIY